MDVKYTMATIRRRRRRRATKRLMGRGMHMVRRPRRQRGERMHYMRRRFQKGKGLCNAQTQVPIDLVGFPMFALMALTGHLQDKLAH